MTPEIEALLKEADAYMMKHPAYEYPYLLEQLAAALRECAEDAEPVAWMYESEHSCAGPFTERRVTFDLDRWTYLPPKYKETALYAARREEKA